MNPQGINPRLAVFPDTAGESDTGNLILGGCDAVSLAVEYGTPLYVFDEATIISRCTGFTREFDSRYPGTQVLYAGKAFTSMAILKMVGAAGLGMDAVSAGEMYIAREAGFSMERVFLHGNNKPREELEMALELGVGRIVVDNLDELALLSEIVAAKGVSADILLRLSPGIDPHTHRYNTTGIVDSKFGLTMTTWEQAVKTAMAAPGLALRGLHFHLGSLIAETEPYVEATAVVVEFAARMQEKHGFKLEELDIGGGFGVAYTLDDEVPSVAHFAKVVTGAVKDGCRKAGLPEPQLYIEPGRAIVAQAGVALYRVGMVKDIPGVRTYVAVDGGMGDNIRHALYGARHEAVVVNRLREKNTKTVTIAGKYCESGDILIPDIEMPELENGDVIAVAGCGAYCVPMASNYNASRKPAIVMVKDGEARLVRQRESLADLTRLDVA